MIQNGESQITESIENVELEKICSTLVEKTESIWTYCYAGDCR